METVSLQLRKDESNRSLLQQQRPICQYHQKIDESEQNNSKLQERMKEKWIRRHQKHQQQQQQQLIVSHELTIARLSGKLSITQKTILEQMCEIEELQLSNTKMAKALTFGEEKNLWTPE